MITEYDMSTEFRNVYLASPRRSSIVGDGGPGGQPDYSESTQQYIDEETARIINERHERVLELLEKRPSLLEAVARRLREVEKVTAEESRGGPRLPERHTPTRRFAYMRIVGLTLTLRHRHCTFCPAQRASWRCSLSMRRFPAPMAIIAMAVSSVPLFALDMRLDILVARWELRPGLTTTVWSYNGLVPGTPIVVSPGETVVIQGTNRLLVPTNIHWHGLLVPNDQDGPGKAIQPGESFLYQFTVQETGTYWYHSHQRPVLSQVDRGLYGSFVVRAPEDARYSGDHTLVLDDWYLDAAGSRIEGTAQGDMERYGNVETVNGKTGGAIEPLQFQKGELHKLRLINASTAAVHELRATGHRFRVTHTDGHALTQPYSADAVTLAPGERLDVEVEAVGVEGQSYVLASSRPQRGIRVPITYRAGSRAQVVSPFVAPPSRAIPGARDRLPDYVLDLNSAMGMGGMGGMDHGGMAMGESSAAGMVSWTINGVSFPETEPLFVKTGELVKVRMRNRDTGTGMQHPMDHPMHIHGAFFQVVSFNGREPERETWKDTIVVPAGEYVDVAFIMQNAGQWMFHCHVIDHEDGGMMTTVEAST